MPTVQLWRCSGCGKWSHAKRKPTSHERFVPENGTSPIPDEDAIIEHLPGEYDHLNGQTRGPGWLVRCGPFERWLAVRTDGDLP